MSSQRQVYKFSRSGQVIHDNLTLEDATALVNSGSIRYDDHYWTDGMTEWKLVYTNSWVPVAKDKVKAHAGTVSSPGASPALSAKSASSSPVGANPNVLKQNTPPGQESALAAPVEKGFSPYYTYYRSNDDRWAFGLFGGLAHRNGWPKALLLVIRLLTLFLGLPAFAYLFGFGFTSALLLPSLPTANVRSYFDLNNGKPSRDSTDFGRFIKLAAIFVLVLIVIAVFLSRW